MTHLTIMFETEWLVFAFALLENHPIGHKYLTQ